MLIKNIKLTLSQRDEERATFQTEKGARVVIDSRLLGELTPGQAVYLALDDQPLVSSQEDKKKILNELINPGS